MRFIICCLQYLRNYCDQYQRDPLNMLIVADILSY
jgi:hypothetical protein